MKCGKLPVKVAGSCCFRPKGLSLAEFFFLEALDLQTDLSILATEATRNVRENETFRTFLRDNDPDAIDTLVRELDKEITPRIVCTDCGNCCKSLMVNVTESDAVRAAKHLSMAVATFKENYVEESLQGQMIIHTIPCLFLDETRCSIYEGRFTECRNFPDLDKENFTGRLFATLMHYGRCPIIYNVVEQLKVRTGFSTL